MLKSCVFYSSFNSDLLFWFILGSFLTFWGLNWLILGSGKGSKTVFCSTHVAEQLSFSMLLSILTFDFDLILRSFLTFWGPNVLFLGLGFGSKTVLGSTHAVEQLSFSMFLLILTFDFDLFLGLLLTFGVQWVIFEFNVMVGLGLDNCFFDFLGL